MYVCMYVCILHSPCFHFCPFHVPSLFPFHFPLLSCYVNFLFPPLISLHFLAFPLCSPVFPAKRHSFSSVFAKRTSKNTEFFQIFGKRRQEAQASKRAGRGNQAWDPCFATPALPNRSRDQQRHQLPQGSSSLRAPGAVGLTPPPPRPPQPGLFFKSKFLFLTSTSSNCRAVCGGPPPKKKPTYLTSGGVGVRGGGLSSIL